VCSANMVGSTLGNFLLPGVNYPSLVMEDHMLVNWMAVPQVSGTGKTTFYTNLFHQ
jgi:hypothetical protein